MLIFYLRINAHVCEFQIFFWRLLMCPRHQAVWRDGFWISCCPIQDVDLRAEIVLTYSFLCHPQSHLQNCQLSISYQWEPGNYALWAFSLPFYHFWCMNWTACARSIWWVGLRSHHYREDLSASAQASRMLFALSQIYQQLWDV